jgi:hypothetical protein
MADAPVLEAGAAMREGSSPSLPTMARSSNGRTSHPGIEWEKRGSNPRRVTMAQVASSSISTEGNTMSIPHIGEIQSLIKTSSTNLRDEAKQAYREEMASHLNYLKEVRTKLEEYINSAEATLKGEVSFLAIDRHNDFNEWLGLMPSVMKKLKGVMVKRAKFLLGGRA